MKQLTIYCFLVLTFLSTSVKTNAQTEKGKILVGGQSSLDFTSYKSKEQNEFVNRDNGKSKSLDISPEVGYFIVNNLAVGMETPYNFSKDINGEFSTTTSSVTLVPFVRYYYGKAKIKPYLHVGIGPGWGNSKTVMPHTPDIKISTHLLAYEMGGGIGIFINEHVALDLGMGYVSVSSKWLDPNNKMNFKDTNSGFSASIGIVVCL